MSSEPLHSAFDALRARLQAELDTQLASLQTTIEVRHGEALAEAKRSFAADVEQLWSSKLGSLREEWASRLRGELAAASTEASRTLAAEVERLEGEKAAAVATASTEATRRLTAEVSRLEAEKAAAVAAASTEAARTLVAEVSRLEAEKAAAVAAAGIRHETEDVPRPSLYRLAGSLRRISGASSLAHALDALADGAAAEAPFTALFIVATATSVEGAESATLERWRSAGVEGQELAQATLPATGVFADAVRTRQPTTTTGAAPAFASAQSGPPGLVVPVVGEQAVAVLYAEGDASVDSSEVWQEAVQILGQHASACLSLLTAARISQVLGTGPAPDTSRDDDGSARRYARLLVSEIKLYNESAVRTGRERRPAPGARFWPQRRAPPHTFTGTSGAPTRDRACPPAL